MGLCAPELPQVKYPLDQAFIKSFLRSGLSERICKGTIRILGGGEEIKNSGGVRVEVQEDALKEPRRVSIRLHTSP